MPLRALYRLASVAATGFDSSTHEPVFAAGLQGVARADAPRVEALVLDTLANVARTGAGLEPERVEAVLHQVEVSLRHVSSHFGIGTARHGTGAGRA